MARTRGKHASDFSLAQYVNDRPYAASSLLAVALGDVFSTARAGRCNARPELAASAIPLKIVLPALADLPAAHHVTRSDVQARGLPGAPRAGFEEYLGWGVQRGVCEEKHMGSRAVAVIARDADAAERCFGVGDGTTGAVYTRTGRPFFAESAELVERLRTAVAPSFESLDTDWLALDCELLPWSAKAMGLIKEQYASVGAAARSALPEALTVLQQAAARGLDVGDLVAKTERRLAHAEAFRDAYAAYIHPTDGLDGVTLAPFQILAAQGRASRSPNPTSGT